jgi:hypothetical protein
MWNFLILMVMVSLAGFYTIFNKDDSALSGMPSSMPIAENMALYRTAVINYRHDHPDDDSAVVPQEALSQTPPWSTLATTSPYATWANYRNASGITYIYAMSPPRVNIVNDLLQVSENSELVGENRGGTGTLYSPTKGNTNIALPAEVSIPIGSPVWVAIGT